MSAWYRTGTVSVTNGSATVTGSGTAWLVAAKPGDAFTINGDRFYEVMAVNSNTSLTLRSPYVGATASGQAYAIQPVSRLWKETARLFAATAELLERLAAGAANIWAITKATAGASAVVEFVTTGVSRARVGTVANNNLSMQVSATGSSWTDAIVVDNATGRVSLPAGVETVAVADGTAGAPAVRFNAASNAGFYRVGASQLGFSVAGVDVMRAGTSGTLVPAGTAAAPGLSFLADTTAGLYRISSTAVGVAVAGAEVARFTTAGPRLLDGTAAAPAVSFTSETGTGLFRAATGVLGFSISGTERARLDSAGRLALNVTSPEGVVHVSSATGIISDRLSNGPSFTARFASPTAGGSSSATVDQLRSRGTLAAPADVQAGDFIGSNRWFGYGGGAWQQLVSLVAVAEDGMAGAAGGGQLRIRTRLPGGTGQPTDRVIITASGAIGVGTTSPTASIHTTGAIRSGSYTLAALPSAAALGAGAIVYCSNLTGGAMPVFSDGTNWRRVSDRSIAN